MASQPDRRSSGSRDDVPARRRSIRHDRRRWRPVPDRERVVVATQGGVGWRERLAHRRRARPPAFLQLRTVGKNGFYATVDVGGGGESYSVTALVPTLGTADPKDLTVHKLEAAGTEYPEAIVKTYVAAGVPEGAIGPDARKLLNQIKA